MGNPGNQYRRFKLKHSLAHADLILTVSEVSRSEILKLLHRNTEVLVIPNALPDGFEAIPRFPRPNSPGPIKVLHFGGHSPTKSTKTVLRAIALLNERGTKTHLVLAAMSGQLKLVEEWRQEARLASAALTVLPSISDEALRQIYSECDLHCMPSTGEGFGIPVIEAAMCGTPNVLSPLPVFRELLGDHAIFADSMSAESIAEAIKKCMTSDLQELTACARARSERFLFESVHRRDAVGALERIEDLAVSRLTRKSSQQFVTMPSTRKRRVTAIWSRDVNKSRLAGRTRIIAAIREATEQQNDVTHLRLNNVLERRTLRAAFGATSAAFRSILTGNLPSLQCLLFCDRGNHKDIRKHLQDNPPDTLYCDGVRTFYLLKYIKDLRGQMRIVVDLDDLMSRRMQSLDIAEASLSLGYLHDRVPSWLGRALALGSVSKLVARYEHAALLRVENQIGQLADAVVLLSRVEGSVLDERYRSLGFSAKVHVIPPPKKVVAPPQSYPKFSRFIFIGTDALPQNKSTIQIIVDLWQSLNPAAEIHLFGRMVSNWPVVSGVVFRGYVERLEDVYIEGAVLFAPGGLRGGIKTKVVEAFAHGCAVIGNEITFEGLQLPDYPLLVTSEMDLIRIVNSPSSYLSEMKVSAAIGQECVKRFFSQEHFGENWDGVLG
jgi:glycosyltransferase involved in cell wall biosynthesis